MRTPLRGFAASTRARLRAEAGMTLAELMIAMVLLLVGLLATFVMLDVANGNEGKASAREGATNLARELLEDAHRTPYAQIGASNWFQSTLQTVSGGSGTVTTGSNTFTQSTTVTRRNVAYNVSVTSCSIDDSRDGNGTHAVTTNWCSDSTATGTSDSQPEDMKRVTVHMTWSIGGGPTQQMDQVVTFSSNGAAIGPAVTTLTITTPNTYTGQSNPVVTANPTGGNIVFTATSAGAADMKFSVNGVEQTSGVASIGNGQWTFTWPVTSLPDATYTITATAIDVLGTRGQPRSLPVQLNRGTPAPIANLAGGYNYVWTAANPPPGTKALVVELRWDANAEGSVTGYEVDRGATVVCGGQTSLSTECIDTGAPSTGSTTYTLKTYYHNSSGSIQSISTTYTVTAPSPTALPTKYGFTSGTANSGTACYNPATGGFSGGGIQRDAVSTYPTSGGTNQTFSGTAGGGGITGCMPIFGSGISLGSGTNTATFSGWFTNTSTTLPCDHLQWIVTYGATLATANEVAGNAANSSAASFVSIPANTTTPTLFTQSTNTAAHTFNAGDQLGITLGNFTSSSTKKSPLYDCSKTTFYYGSGTYQSTVTLSTLTNGSSGTTLSQPSAPTGLTIVVNADGTRTLTWNAATGTPAPDFYRIYRDGQKYTDRYDTAGDTGQSTITWTDTATGGTSHTYYVTTVASTLAESATMVSVTG